MKKIKFEDMMEQSDERYDVPAANVDDIKKVINTIEGMTVPTKQEQSKQTVSLVPQLKEIAVILQGILSVSGKEPIVQNHFDVSRLVKSIEGVNLTIANQTIENMKNNKFKEVITSLNKMSEKLEPKEEGLHLECYRVSDSKEPVTGIQYFGFVDAEGKWYILYNDATEGTVRYKFGVDNYTSAWKDCDKYDYKLLNEAIDEIKN